MIAPLTAAAGANANVLVGPETGDDAGVYLHDGTAWVATVDFITPVCDDPRRYGRVAAANSISDVYAMGGSPTFALNLCCFPDQVPRDWLTAILEGAAELVRASGATVLGGHTVTDKDLKFGLAVVGRADPDRLITNAAAHVGDRLILTKPIGTGVMINAFRAEKLDAEGLEPALVQMERTNADASALALRHGVRAGTDVTGFGLAGHALAIARASNVGMTIRFDSVPVHDAFYGLVERGVSTGATKPNRANVEAVLENRIDLGPAQQEVLFDPQTSGGLLVAVAPDRAAALLRELLDAGHPAAEIGEVGPGPAGITVI